MVTNIGQAASRPGRVYRSPLRVEQARRTRRSIVQAAGECFADSGFAYLTARLDAAFHKVGKVSQADIDSVESHPLPDVFPGLEL